MQIAVGAGVLIFGRAWVTNRVEGRFVHIAQQDRAQDSWLQNWGLHSERLQSIYSNSGNASLDYQHANPEPSFGEIR